MSAAAGLWGRARLNERACVTSRPGGLLGGATQASKAVADYFKAVSSASFGFTIVSATPAIDGYVVVCEFFPFLGSQLTRYTVSVDDKGDIRTVERVAESA